MPASAEVLEAMASEGPPRGSIWRHFKGHRYMVLDRGIIEKTLEPAVIYKSLEDGVVWVRPMGEWEETIERDGQKHQRFIWEE